MGNQLSSPLNYSCMKGNSNKGSLYEAAWFTQVQRLSACLGQYGGLGELLPAKGPSNQLPLGEILDRISGDGSSDLPQRKACMLLRSRLLLFRT